jgi:hypothetical protein
MRLNLILCVMWLIIGVGLLSYRQLHPEISGTPTENVALWGGIIGILLCLYNLVRWWSSRALARHRAEPKPRREPRPRSATLEYNPEFDFTRNGPRTLGEKDESGNG